MTKRNTRNVEGPERQPVHQWSEVPQFGSEREEQAFWDTHTLGEELLDQMQPGGPDDLCALPVRTATRSRTIAVRFEDDVLKRVRAVAAKKHIAYQTLLKAFVLERLYEEEKREGLIA